jgi:hypothetical protein
MKSEINEYLGIFCNILYSVIWIFEDDHNARPDTFVKHKGKKEHDKPLEKDATQESAGWNARTLTTMKNILYRFISLFHSHCFLITEKELGNSSTFKN